MLFGDHAQVRTRELEHAEEVYQEGLKAAEEAVNDKVRFAP